jgi:hypothetical protein
MALPQEIKAQLATDPSKINPTGASQEDLTEYQRSLDAQIKSLEQRYANPNWFKVAAGFLKPQLGGFAASLGSASQALGESVELQRAAELPIAQMRSQLAQSKILTGQNKTQSDEFETWRASGKPMDAATYARIVSVNPDSPVAKAAKAFYEGAKSGLEITTAATTAMGKDPMLQLQDYTKFQLKPNVDQTEVDRKQAEINKAIDASRPTNVDPAKWAAMGRYEKMALVSDASRVELEKGMDAEDILRQQANTAPERLGLLRSIRDVALGAGIPETVAANGEKVSGQEQMSLLLNKFGGNNPVEVFARAMADGKGPELLREIDKYARQYGMSEQAKDKFQVLVKLLAENQVTLRNSALNPTNAFSELQQTASPNISNSQKSLVTLVDLMGHAEKAAQERYNYAKEKGLPYGQLERDPGYNALRSAYAQKHVEIATGDPTKTVPVWYNPSVGNVTAKPEAKPEAKPQGNAPVTPSGSNLTRDAIKAEIAKREAAKNKAP